MKFLQDELKSKIDEINEKMNNAIERKKKGEEIDYYNDFNKYFFALQEIRKILEQL